MTPSSQTLLRHGALWCLAVFNLASTNVSLDRSPWSGRVTSPAQPAQFKTNKVIYRRYAGLYFSLCVDVTDNELAYLESIHLFV